MKNKKTSSVQCKIHPLTPERWKDFENLFGKSGACGGCWCMWWRRTHSEFEKQKGDGNKRTMNLIVQSGNVPGLLAYYDDEPIGWCSIAQREEYIRLERSRVLKRIDEKPVWSIVCFFISKTFRCQGISIRLIEEAIDYAGSNGAKIIEGYPIDPKSKKSPDVFAYTGLKSAFIKTGFIEVIRRSETRPIMRYFY